MITRINCFYVSVSGHDKGMMPKSMYKYGLEYLEKHSEITSFRLDRMNCILEIWFDTEEQYNTFRESVG